MRKELGWKYSSINDGSSFKLFTLKYIIKIYYDLNPVQIHHTETTEMVPRAAGDLWQTWRNKWAEQGKIRELKVLSNKIFQLNF